MCLPNSELNQSVSQKEFGWNSRLEAVKYVVPRNYKQCRKVMKRKYKQREGSEMKLQKLASLQKHFPPPEGICLYPIVIEE